MDIPKRKNARGHRVVTTAEREYILNEISNGMTVAQAARRYELAMQTLHRWVRMKAQGVPFHPISDGRAKEQSDQSATLSELRRLQEELKATRKSLAKMTVERDILKDAVEIATKKKWI